jgi:hypothetical protein
MASLRGMDGRAAFDSGAPPSLWCGMPAPRSSGAAYEFTAEENKIFERLVRNMSRSGSVAVIASLVLLGYHFVDFFGVSLGKSGSPAILYVDYAAWFLISLIGVSTGILLIRATAAFSALIHTEGDDLGHLMQGMKRLGDILGLVFWAAAGASILLVISFVLLLTYS